MSSNLTLLPAHSGTNLAELKPLLKLGDGDKRPSSTLQESIKERLDHYKNIEKSTWDDMNKAGEEVSLFFAGQQYLTPSPYSKGPHWIPYKVGNVKTENEKRALSVMQYHVSGNLEKWCNSKPDVRVRPGIESDEAYEASEAAKIVVDHYESKFYGERVSIAECLEAMTFGSYIWRLRVDPTLKSVTAYRQIFENKEIKIGKGWGKCGDCSYEGTEADFNHIEDEGIYTCTKCHSEALVIPAASDNVDSLAQTEPVELGDFRLDLVPFSQCKWDLRFHADESPWLIIRRRTTEAALRQILGNVRLTQGGSSDVGLDVIDRLAYSGQARAGYGNDSQKRTLYKDPATVEEFWMSPDDYGDITLKEDTQTVDGETIPKDVPLGELTQGKNICVLGINDMSTVLGVWIEDHRDYIVQGKWYSKTGTGAGRGLQDLVEVQKVFNSDHQKLHTYMRSVSTPAMLVASEVLGEEGKSAYINNPGENIPVSLAMLKEGVGMNDLVAPAFQPPAIPAQMFEFTYNRLGEFAQFASHFLPFTGGIPGVDNETATGANITQAATNALYTPVLSVKGEVRKLVAEKLVKLYPKHFPVDRDFPLGGKFQRHTGKFISVNGSLLDTQLLFEVIADSWNPNNSYVKRQNYAAFGQTASLLVGIEGYLSPDRMADLERAFDLDMESEPRNVAESLCFRRVRLMQAQAQMITDPMQLAGVQPEVQPDPTTGQPVPTGKLMPTGQGVIQPPISAAEPQHSVKREWLMAFLDSDEGQEAPPHLRQAVELLIKLHTDLEGVQGGILATQSGELQVAQAQPGMEAQMEMQAAAGQQQMEQQEQQMGLQAQQALGEQVVAQQELENKAAAKDMDNEALKEKNAIRASDREHQLAVKVAQKEMK